MFNKAFLAGRIGKDPQTTFANSGTCILNFSLASSEWRSDANNGQGQEVTEWHNVTVIGKLAESLSKRIQKGTVVLVEGKIETQKYQDSNGQDKYSTKIMVTGMGHTVKTISGTKQQNGQGAPANNQQGGYQQPSQGGYQQPQGGQQQPQQQGGYQQPQGGYQQPSQGGYQQPQGGQQQRGNNQPQNWNQQPQQQPQGGYPAHNMSDEAIF